MGDAPSAPFEPDVLDPYVRRLILHKARQFRRHPALRDLDAEDLAGELTVRLLGQADRHDPARGSFHTFADRVLGNHGRNLIEHATRAKRDARRVDVGVDPDATSGGDPRDDADRRDAAIDVRCAVAALPPDLRTLADLLTTHDVPDARRALRLTRSAMRCRVARLRRHFFDHFRDRSGGPDFHGHLGARNCK